MAHGSEGASIGGVQAAFGLVAWHLGWRGILRDPRVPDKGSMPLFGLESGIWTLLCTLDGPWGGHQKPPNLLESAADQPC
jgi:hypothetical protein